MKKKTKKHQFKKKGAAALQFFPWAFGILTPSSFLDALLGTQAHSVRGQSHMGKPHVGPLVNSPAEPNH